MSRKPSYQRVENEDGDHQPSSPSSPPPSPRFALPSFISPVVLSILVTETAERFSYFGFRAILVLYFRQALRYDESTAISLFAFVTCLAYFSPIFGAVVADAYLGQYLTILLFGILYGVGLFLLTFGAYVQVQYDEAGDGGGEERGGAGDGESLFLKKICTFIGLLLVCIGTGGIKPCVSAFGADQVACPNVEGKGGTIKAKIAHADSSLLTDIRGRREQILEPEGKQHTPLETQIASESNQGKNKNKEVRAFFAYFYFCINVGAVLSITIVPIIRSNYGFGAAFLAPTTFLALAFAIFISKRKQYVMRSAGGDHDRDSSLAMMLRVFCALLARRLRSGNIVEEGPLPFPRQQIQDADAVVRIMPILGLLPIFWMLYDQQGSVWTLQASRMNLHGWQPEQLNIVNPVEIMIFIPLFDKVIYPWMDKCGLSTSHLKRMEWGMLLSALSFVFSGVLETVIEDRDGDVSVFWQLPQITVLAVAEILLSVTGLEFAYSMSPERIKALIMAIYLLTTAVGNLFGGILYSSVFKGLGRSVIMYVCAGLMLLNTICFRAVSHWWERNREDVLRTDEIVEAGVELRTQVIEDDQLHLQLSDTKLSHRNVASSSIFADDTNISSSK